MVERRRRIYRFDCEYKKAVGWEIRQRLQCRDVGNRGVLSLMSCFFLLSLHIL